MKWKIRKKYLLTLEWQYKNSLTLLTFPYVSSIQLPLMSISNFWIGRKKGKKKKSILEIHPKNLFLYFMSQNTSHGDPSGREAKKSFFNQVHLLLTKCNLIVEKEGRTSTMHSRLSHDLACNASVPYESQLPADISGKSVKDGPNVSAPATNEGDLDGIPDSQLWLGSVPADVVVWGNEPEDGSSLSTITLIILPFK